MFTILDYSSALEYSIIRRYTNIVYYYYYYKRRFEHDEFNYSYPTIKESNGLLLFSTMPVC